MKKTFCLVVLIISFMLCGVTTVNASDGTAIPFAITEVSNIAYVDVAKQLAQAGFTDVVTDEVYDVDPDNGNAYTSISVQGYSEFEKNDIIPTDAKIFITGHFPFEQHAVSITIDFEENWIFDKYGITLSLGDETPVALEHGQSGTFEFAVPTGTCRLYPLQGSREGRVY